MDCCILTMLAGLALLYCCDLPAIDGFEFLINKKDTLLYGVGVSVIAAYIFYIIQVWMPRKRQEYRAYFFIKEKVEKYLNEIYEIVTFVESMCVVNRNDEKIVIETFYVFIDRSDWDNLWLEKIDLQYYKRSVEKLKVDISNSDFFLQLSDKQVKILQKIMSNDFVEKFEQYSRLHEKMTFPELLPMYDRMKHDLVLARKVFKIKGTMALAKVEDNNMVKMYEQRIEIAKEYKDEKMKGVFRMKVGKK